MSLCRTCTYWGKTDPDWAGNDFGDDVSTCGAMDSSTDVKKGAKAFGHYGYEAGVATHAEFGCTMHEPKDEAHA